jgi:hypothetical protein
MHLGLEICGRMRRKQQQQQHAYKQRMRLGSDLRQQLQNQQEQHAHEQRTHFRAEQRRLLQHKDEQHIHTRRACTSGSRYAGYCGTSSNITHASSTSTSGSSCAKN